MTDTNSAKTEIVKTQRYLSSLLEDDNFQKYFLTPLKAQRDYYVGVLMSVESSEAELRAAQGAMHLIEFLRTDIFKDAERRFASLIEEERTRDVRREDTRKQRSRLTNASDYIESRSLFGS